MKFKLIPIETELEEYGIFCDKRDLESITEKLEFNGSEMELLTTC